MIRVTGGLVLFLTAGFVVLRLTEFIDWPWVWVLSPLWISSIVSLSLVFIFAGIIKAYVFFVNAGIEKESSGMDNLINTLAKEMEKKVKEAEKTIKENEKK